MTHEELLAKLWILPADVTELEHGAKAVKALRAVVELHKPELWKALTGEFAGTEYAICAECSQQRKGYKFYVEVAYPCSTIQAIEKELT